MTKEELDKVESSQRQHYETMCFQEKMFVITEQYEYNLFKMLKPKIFIDGDKYCVLYGENIQEGICGFGESPYKAILDFNREWNKPIKEQ